MAHTTQVAENANKTGYERLLDMVEFNRFSFVFITLIFPACIGGLAAGMGAMNDLFQLLLIAMVTMLNQALVLGVAPMRILVPSFIISMVINTAVLLINVL